MLYLHAMLSFEGNRMRAKIFTILIAVSAMLVLSAPAQADQGLLDEAYVSSLVGQMGPPPPMPGKNMARFIVTLYPMISGPAVTTGDVEMHVGAGLSGCFNFMRRESVRIGVDVQVDLGVPVLTGGGNEPEGTWLATSIAVPIRLGGSTNFFFRPGICFDYLDYYKDGGSIGDYWEDEVNGSLAVGIVIGLGMEINIHRRFAIGVNLNLRFLPLSHDVENFYNGSDDGTESGWFTPQVGMRFMLRI
jgi:hypothetical protein